MDLVKLAEDLTKTVETLAEEIKVNRLAVSVLQRQGGAANETQPLHFGRGGQPFQEFQSVGQDCLKL